MTALDRAKLAETTQPVSIRPPCIDTIFASLLRGTRVTRALPHDTGFRRFTEIFASPRILLATTRQTRQTAPRGGTNSPPSPTPPGCPFLNLPTHTPHPERRPDRPTHLGPPRQSPYGLTTDTTMRGINDAQPPSPRAYSFLSVTRLIGFAGALPSPAVFGNQAVHYHLIAVESWPNLGHVPRACTGYAPIWQQIGNKLAPGAPKRMAEIEGRHVADRQAKAPEHTPSRRVGARNAAAEAGGHARRGYAFQRACAPVRRSQQAP